MNIVTFRDSNGEAYFGGGGAAPQFTIMLATQLMETE